MTPVSNRDFEFEPIKSEPLEAEAKPITFAECEPAPHEGGDGDVEAATETPCEDESSPKSASQED